MSEEPAIEASEEEAPRLLHSGTAGGVSIFDRIEGPSSYWLPGIGTVQVIPRGGVIWNQPADYSFDRLHSDRGVLTAADMRSRYAPATPQLPPTDVHAGTFVCCGSCGSTPAYQRCSGCPRGRVRLNVRRRTEPIPERKPRRWLRWRKRESCQE
jgi:hypothetical protein